MKIPKEPALILGLVGSIVAFVLQVIAQTEGQTLTAAQWATIIVPGAFGILTRYQVVAAQTVRDAITRVNSSAAVVKDLSDRVGVAVGERPDDSRRPI